MIELLDTAPDLSVQPAEYQRLLGYPRDYVLTDRALELAEGARAWYAEHGRPWMYAREAGAMSVAGNLVTIDGVPFESKRLAGALSDALADRVVLVAVSAGPELEAESLRLWNDEKPDEYFFHEIYGSAVVEHLVMVAGGALCAAADRDTLAVLPHYSPGYPEWDITDQGRLLQLIAGNGHGPLPGPVAALESGMLRPKKSLIAVFGMTPHTDRARKLSGLVPCEGCSLPRCQYRRAAYRKPRRLSEVEAMHQVREVPPLARTEAPIQLGGKYSLSTKALKRWTAERLTLSRNSDGTLDASFRYDGTTCSNTGREFRFLYTVTLGTREERYPIIFQQCVPVAGDEGHRFMCRYRATDGAFLQAIGEEKPLAGQPIDDVLTWTRAPVAASCYCDNGSAHHKWGMVLETIHYAVAEQEKDMVDIK
ncbi:MAG: Vitamin dependent methionine synthase activation region [Gemmatimonadetes bacterium]|nr:Vitamin dependent methionine synthase activation region [Gemmatimonadota bacterium]